VGADYKLRHISPIMWKTNSNVAANTTAYFTTETSAAELIIQLIAPEDGIIDRLIVQSQAAPGVGETFDYTFRLNTANTLLAAQIAGGVQVQAEDLVNVIAVARGDVIDILLVTSLNAVVCVHRGSMRYRRT